MPLPTDLSGLPRPEFEARVAELLAEVAESKRLVVAQCRGGRGQEASRGLDNRP